MPESAIDTPLATTVSRRALDLPLSVLDADTKAITVAEKLRGRLQRTQMAKNESGLTALDQLAKVEAFRVKQGRGHPKGSKPQDPHEDMNNQRPEASRIAKWFAGGELGELNPMQQRVGNIVVRAAAVLIPVTLAGSLAYDVSQREEVPSTPVPVTATQLEGQAGE